MTIPIATYRLQLHAGFTFADAEAIVPYLAELGISHIYASPITTACVGSMHGYDVVDPTRVSPALGGEQGLEDLVATLRVHGMGLIVDIVPNHMGVAGDANAWWLDVLKHGRASQCAATFDIDWDGPLILPVLGTPLLEAIAAGDLRLVERERSLGLRLYDAATYPLRPDDAVLTEDRAGALARHDPSGAEGRAALLELAGRQHYRLTYWRAANDILNWRRFFAINDLAGVRAEDPHVFMRTHALYIDLYRRRLIDGVRVDHVDGLTDPAAYCRQLRSALENAVPGDHAYIVVEKILAADEALPSDWEVDGTSGYDFMREVGALLHDPAGVQPLQRLWERLSGRSGAFAWEARTGRRELLAWQFEGQLVACVDRFAVLAESAGLGWVTRGMLRRAVEGLLWVFPVYRTYGTGCDAPRSDREVREAARAAAAALAAPGEAGIIDLVVDWLAGCGEGHLALKREAVRRFQQLAAPVAAKGVEDTAFYRYGVLLSANEVGSDPGQMTAEVAAFHASMSARARDYPAAMLATGTHDHKRGEDARARLAALSSVPLEWERTVGRWIDMAAPHSKGLASADVYQLFQTLVGAWTPDGDLLPRVQAWQRKALREAKLRSSWESPDEDYEKRYAALAEALLAPAGEAPFRNELERFVAALGPAAEANTIAQTALHYLAPGVPDLYQGAELNDYSMVDPDNRRPVDFARRHALLESARTSEAGGKLGVIAELLALRRSQPTAFAGAYVPLAVTGERNGHVVAFTRGQGTERLTCAVAIRLGATLFGTREAKLAPGWWGDTKLEIDGRRIGVGDRLGTGLFAVWSENP